MATGAASATAASVSSALAGWIYFGMLRVFIFGKALRDLNSFFFQKKNGFSKGLF